MIIFRPIAMHWWKSLSPSFLIFVYSTIVVLIIFVLTLRLSNIKQPQFREAYSFPGSGGIVGHCMFTCLV